MAQALRFFAIVPFLGLLSGCLFWPGGHSGSSGFSVYAEKLDGPPEHFIQWESTPEEQRPPELEELFDQVAEVRGTSKTSTLKDDRVEIVKRFCEDEWNRQVGGPTPDELRYHFAHGGHYYSVGFLRSFN